MLINMKVLQQNHGEVPYSRHVSVHSLHPIISMKILPSALYTFRNGLTRKICWTMKSFSTSDAKLLHYSSLYLSILTLFWVNEHLSNTDSETQPNVHFLYYLRLWRSRFTSGGRLSTGRNHRKPVLTHSEINFFVKIDVLHLIGRWWGVIVFWIL